MSLIGTLGIELDCDGGMIVAVRFDAPKPVPINRLLGGRTPEEVPGIVGTLFPLCGLAQAACAASALETALASEVSETGRAARAALVAAEALREHVTRISVDWPTFVGEGADGNAFAATQKALGALRTALFGDANPFAPGVSVREINGGVRLAVERMEDAAGRSLFGDAPDRWSAYSSLAGMEDWATKGLTPAARLLARLLSPTAKQMTTEEAEDGTPYGRYHDHATVAALRAAYGELPARVGARLIEVMTIVRALGDYAIGRAGPKVMISEAGETDGTGHARVDVARGALVHDVRLDGGRVAEYRIAAPTTANFENGGAAERALLRIRASDRSEMEWRARLTVLELDPCVAYELRIT
jgi:coenzyme F420-reducing hydrogenase alpha subunit